MLFFLGSHESLFLGFLPPWNPRKPWKNRKMAENTQNTKKFPWSEKTNRRRTNVQQLTCKIDLSNSFYYLFFSFVLIELKPFVLKGKVLGEKFWKSAKKCQKVWKIVKNYETILPFSCCPLVFLWTKENQNTKEWKIRGGSSGLFRALLRAWAPLLRADFREGDPHPTLRIFWGYLLPQNLFFIFWGYFEGPSPKYPSKQA